MAEDITGGGDILAGFGIVDLTRGESSGSLYGATDAGMTAHRGTLHPDEYVDYHGLRDLIEADLGFSYAEITAAYKTGRPTAEQRQQREKIDARLLALSRAGGNMTEFANAVGLGHATVERALARARAIHVEPMVKTGVVKTRVSCFICGEPGTPRKRKHSTSPPQWVGTVNLCDDHYTQGFVNRPGNPEYWDFRDKCVIPGGVS
jgi:hypothetical protein